MLASVLLALAHLAKRPGGLGYPRRRGDYRRRRVVLTLILWSRTSQPWKLQQPKSSPLSESIYSIGATAAGHATFRVGKAGDDALEPASLLASETPSDGVTVPEGPSEAVGDANAFSSTPKAAASTLIGSMSSARGLPGFGVGSLSRIFFLVSEITLLGSNESMDPSCDADSSSRASVNRVARVVLRRVFNLQASRT